MQILSFQSRNLKIISRYNIYKNFLSNGKNISVLITFVIISYMLLPLSANFLFLQICITLSRILFFNLIAFSNQLLTKQRSNLSQFFNYFKFYRLTFYKRLFLYFPFLHLFLVVTSSNINHAAMVSMPCYFVCTYRRSFYLITYMSN